MKKPNAKRNAFREETASDPRSNEALFAELRVCQDDDEWWKIIRILRARQDESIIRRALEMCYSDEPELRDIGATLVYQDPDWVTVHFAEECLQTLLVMVGSEKDVDALCSVISASRCFKHRGFLREVIKHKAHPNSDVRDSVVRALGWRTEPEATAALIELSSDDNVDVRNWSTFYLELNHIDTPEIRNALRARLLDDDDETRSEALAGLAMRGDEGVIPFIRQELITLIDKEKYFGHVLDAIQEMPEPKFQPYLVYLYEIGYDDDVFQDAIESCAVPKDPFYTDWDGELTSCPVCGLKHAFCLSKKMKECPRCGWHYSKRQINYPDKQYKLYDISLNQSRSRWRRRCRPDLDLVGLQIAWSSDSDDSKRNIATCYLGWLDRDNTEIRGALHDRLTDPNDEVRFTAMYGLAKRDDESVIPYIRKELAAVPDQDDIWFDLFRAAAEIRDPEFLPLLLPLRDIVESTDPLDEAITACAVPEGITRVEWDGALTSCPVCGLKHAFRLPEQVECIQCHWLYSLDQLNDPTLKYTDNRLSLEQARRRWERLIGVVL